MDIPDDQKIVYVKLESDGERLRKMTVDLSSWEKKTWGTFDGDWNDHPMKTFIFEDKADLLGMYAFATEEEDGSYGIVNLGFLANECPIRDLFEWETNYHSDKSPVTAFIIEADRDEKSIIGLIIVVSLRA